MKNYILLFLSCSFIVSSCSSSNNDQRTNTQNSFDATCNGRWFSLKNKPDCEVWNHCPQPSEIVKWSGACKNGKVHGEGSLEWSYGTKADRFVGEFKDGKKNGHGTYTWSNGQKYVGDWENGDMHGNGYITWPNGETYVGDWIEDDREGQGTYSWPDGSQYVGEHKDSRRHGSGILYDPNGKIKKQGIWKYGKFIGPANHIKAKDSTKN